MGLLQSFQYYNNKGVVNLQTRVCFAFLRYKMNTPDYERCGIQCRDQITRDFLSLETVA